MKFSVIIPNFNDKRIKRALKSVKSQDYNDIEIIVVHGGAIDQEFKDIYNDYKPDKLIVESDKGIFDALNKGLERASGDLIYLLGADDYLSGPNVFKDVNSRFLEDKGLDGICIGCMFVNSKGKTIRKWFTKKISNRRIKMGLLPPHFSLFLKKELYDIVGSFNYKYSNNVATDSIWLLDLALAKDNLNIKIENSHFLNMEYGGASTGSFKNILHQFKVIYRYVFSKRQDLPFWIFFPLIKSGSKFFQFRL
jgi:glycosyltransferase